MCGVRVGVEVPAVGEVLMSLQPHRMPGVLQVGVVLEVAEVDAGVVITSLQPHKIPGVLQLDVVLAAAEVDAGVVISLQPHKIPGVLQVDVLPAAAEDDVVVLVTSLHPHMTPGVLQVVVVDEEEDGEEGDGLVDVVVGSLHPNHPGVSQVVMVAEVDFGVVVGGLEVVPGVVVVPVSVVLLSLHQNHPSVLHVDVLLVEVEDVEVEGRLVWLVVSSRHPHQPGVLHVSVLVAVGVVLVVFVVVCSLPLLRKNFQLGQSTHALSGWQDGTVLYFLSTSLITLTIRWVPIATRQPKSWTVSYTHLLPVKHTDSIA